MTQDVLILALVFAPAGAAVFIYSSISGRRLAAAMRRAPGDCDVDARSLRRRWVLNNSLCGGLACAWTVTILGILVPPTYAQTPAQALLENGLAIAVPALLLSISFWLYAWRWFRVE